MVCTMYSRPIHAPTPPSAQNKLSERMRTSAHRLSSSATTTRSNNTIGPECGSNWRISGMLILIAAENQSSVGAAKGKRIAHRTAHGTAETGAERDNIQLR